MNSFLCSEEFDAWLLGLKITYVLSRIERYISVGRTCEKSYYFNSKLTYSGSTSYAALDAAGAAGWGTCTLYSNGGREHTQSLSPLTS